MPSLSLANGDVAVRCGLVLARGPADFGASGNPAVDWLHVARESALVSGSAAELGGAPATGVAGSELLPMDSRTPITKLRG